MAPASLLGRRAARPSILVLFPLLALMACARGFSSPDLPDAGIGGRDAAIPETPRLLLSNAGNDRVVRPGVLVQLDGSASLGIGHARLTQTWTQLAGPPITLSDSSARSPRFRAPSSSADLVFRLDLFASEATHADFVKIFVREGIRDSPPFASAGADLALDPEARSPITLSAAASHDADEDALDFAWFSTAGDPLGSSETLTLNPSGEPLTHRRLVVSDGLLSSKDDVLIWSTPALLGQHPPELLWPETHVTDPGVAVVLWGSATDPDGDPVRLRWRQLDGPSVTLETDNRRARFVAPRKVTRLLFKVHASDGALASAPVPVRVEVTAGQGNRPPTADAGADQSVPPGARVLLDGTSSSDPDGTPLERWEWLQVGGPLLVLERSADPTLAFTAPPDPATLVFALTVFDARVASEPDTVQITIE